jgi:ATP-dependent Clp protease ATP-binding subunit ClpA
MTNPDKNTTYTPDEIKAWASLEARYITSDPTVYLHLIDCLLGALEAQEVEHKEQLEAREREIEELKTEIDCHNATNDDLIFELSVLKAQKDA